MKEIWFKSEKVSLTTKCQLATSEDKNSGCCLDPRSLHLHTTALKCKTHCGSFEELSTTTRVSPRMVIVFLCSKKIITTLFPVSTHFTRNPSNRNRSQLWSEISVFLCIGFSSFFSLSMFNRGLGFYLCVCVRYVKFCHFNLICIF